MLTTTAIAGTAAAATEDDAGVDDGECENAECWDRCYQRFMCAPTDYDCWAQCNCEEVTACSTRSAGTTAGRSAGAQRSNAGISAPASGTAGTSADRGAAVSGRIPNAGIVVRYEPSTLISSHSLLTSVVCSAMRTEHGPATPPAAA